MRSLRGHLNDPDLPTWDLARALTLTLTTQRDLRERETVYSDFKRAVSLSTPSRT